MFLHIATLVSLVALFICPPAQGADLCIPTTGKDVCGVPSAALFSRYDQLYGKKISSYLYLIYEEGDSAALSLAREDPQRSDHFSCVIVSISQATYSGAFKREDIKPGTYYVRVTGELVDSRESGVCIGSLKSSDLNIISRLNDEN